MDAQLAASEVGRRIENLVEITETERRGAPAREFAAGTLPRDQVDALPAIFRAEDNDLLTAALKFESAAGKDRLGTADNPRR